MTEKTTNLTELIGGLLSQFDIVGNSKASAKVRTKGKAGGKPNTINNLTNHIGG